MPIALSPMKKILLLSLFCLTQVGFSQSVQDTVALRAFIDGVMKTHLRDKHIAGGTISIVKDGKVLLAKGYGFADDAKQTPVSADSTLFRIGSISKMFTWFSVMQLVSQGKLDLNADINTYLKGFKIPSTYPEPITLKHLMTHTPGFEDLVIGLFAKDSTGMKPLGEILAEQIPARVRPPGTHASYSNHGTGMAAYIVEQVSGMNFNDYVEKNIINPLGMTRTSFRQPLPKALSPLMSKGYKYQGGVFDERDFEFVPLYPVGAAASSATDMVPFMRAILEGGKLNGFTLLDSATLALMESPAHQHQANVNPMRHGFIDMSRKGVTVIGHGGDTFWFHSMMALFPASNMGLFISFNTNTGGGTASAVMDEFIDRYFAEGNLITPLNVNKEFLDRFTGKYRVNRYAFHDMTTVASMFNDASVTREDSTGLRVAAGENVRSFVPIDSLTFRERNKSGIIAFRKNDKGAISAMYYGAVPIIAFDKVSGLQSADLHIMIFVVAIVTGIVVLVFWPFVALSRLGYTSHRMTKPMPFAARFAAWTNFLFLIIFYCGVAMLANEDTIINGLPSSLKVILCIPFVNIALTLWMLVWMFRVVTVKYHRAASRLYYFFIVVVALAALWQLYFWNLIGP